jgi:hypothetical protein
MDSALVEQCLGRFVRHADLARLALTGSLAMRAQLDGLQSRRGKPDDIDFVASGPESVRPSVTGEFLVSHYHLPAPGYPKFLIQLVDPDAKLRLDVFPDGYRLLPRAVTARVGGMDLLTLRLEDVWEHKLAILANSSGEHPADPKHLEDVELIGRMCGRTVPGHGPLAARRCRALARHRSRMRTMRREPKCCGPAGAQTRGHGRPRLRLTCRPTWGRSRRRLRWMRLPPPPRYWLSRSLAMCRTLSADSSSHRYYRGQEGADVEPAGYQAACSRRRRARP